jgi:ribonuclease HII
MADCAIQGAPIGFDVGVDEAGRGSLAGPVVVCACALTGLVPGLRDSKKLSPKQRLSLACQIVCNAHLTVTLGSQIEIDRINILNSTLQAMKRATMMLSTKCQISQVLIDGNKIPPGMTWKTTAIVGGDDLIDCIMAASIIAKVTRDHIMYGHGRSLPGYGFEIHKGYGTKAHYEALGVLGPSGIHRRSYKLCL